MGLYVGTGSAGFLVYSIFIVLKFYFIGFFAVGTQLTGRKINDLLKL